MKSLEKEFYTIEEALKMVQEMDGNFTEDDFYHYGETEKIKFSLYIGSRPAYGAKYDSATKRYLLTFFCYISGIYQLSLEDLYPITANRSHIIEFLLTDQFVKKPVITSPLPYLPEDVQKAQPEDVLKLWQPEPFDKDSFPSFFVLKPEYMFRLHPKHISELNEHTSPLGPIPYKIIHQELAKKISALGLGYKTADVNNLKYGKKDLRIAHSELQGFISLLTNNNGKPENISLNTSLPSENPFMKEKVKERNQRWQNLARKIQQDNPTWDKAAIVDEIHSREKAKNPNLRSSKGTIERSFTLAKNRRS